MYYNHTKLQKTYEILDEVLKRGDAIELARLLRCSPQLIRAWCRPPETESEFNTGKFSFLDRLQILITMITTEDGSPKRAYPIAQWVARLCWGIFVPLPRKSYGQQSDMMQNFSQIFKETGEAVEETRKAYFEETPGKITRKEFMSCNNEIDEAIVALVLMKRELAKLVER